MTLKLPALIDCHVHFREPGLRHKATMASEAAAAFMGGVHTVCEMPNTLPPTTSIAALEDKVLRAKKLEAVSGKLRTFDMRFFFGITQKPHLDELRALFTDKKHAELRKHCCGVKLFLDHSTGNQKIGDSLLDDAFKTCAELGIVAVCHCEDPATNEKAAKKFENAEHTVEMHSLARPPEAEAASVQHAIGLARLHKTKLHVAHLSTKGAIDLVRAAKQARSPGSSLDITCEVAPHHLFLTVDDYASLGTLAKMNPPLRTKDHQRALWEAIHDGTVDCIATDHAPHTLEEKNADDPLKAPSGVPGVATMLPLLLSVAGGHWPHPKQISDFRFQITYEDIVRLCFENPNRIFNLGKKNTDVIEIDPDTEWIIRAKDLPSLCGWTPYEGWTVKGRVLH